MWRPCWGPYGHGCSERKAAGPPPMSRGVRKKASKRTLGNQPEGASVSQNGLARQAAGRATYPVPFGMLSRCVLPRLAGAGSGRRGARPRPLL